MLEVYSWHFLQIIFSAFQVLGLTHNGPTCYGPLFDAKSRENRKHPGIPSEIQGTKGDPSLMNKVLFVIEMVAPLVEGAVC